VLGNAGENYYEVAYGGYGPFHFKAKDFARLVFELSKREIYEHQETGTLAIPLSDQGLAGSA